MAIGHPRLAVHYFDGTIRLYELASGAFVQLTSTGLYPHTPGSGHPDGVSFPPALAFMDDSAFLMLVHSPTADDTRARTFDSDLTLKGTSANLCGASTGQGVGVLATIDAHNSGVLQAPVGSARVATVASNNPSSFSDVVDAAIGADNGVRGLKYTPDGEFVIVPHKLASTLRKSPRTSYAGVASPIYGSMATVAGVPYPITDGVWLTGTLFLGIGANGAQVFQRDISTSNVTALQDVPKPAGAPVAAAAARDGRWAAASFYDGTTYRTAIYYRQGPFLSLVDTIDGFGKLLAFTADSGLLVDAGLKKALARSDKTWADAPGVMANIADNAVAQATSTHVEDALGVGQLYDNRLSELQDGTLNLSDLYLTLLTNAAPAFDSTDTSAAAAMGSAEVTAGSWPAGGVLLTGVAGTPVGARAWALDVDPVVHLVYPAGMVFRYALVYEKTTDKPVAFFDYQQDYSIPRSTNLTIAFNAGLISITE